MSVRLKLVSIVLFVALLPVSISAYSMLKVHSQALGAALASLHHKSAELGATKSTSYLSHAREALGGLIQDRIDWAKLTPEERSDVLWLIYEQLEGIAVVSLLDEDGVGIGRSVYRDARSTADVLAQHPVVDIDELSEFARALPMREALDRGTAIGVPLNVRSGQSGAMLALAFKVVGAGQRTWIIGVGLSLGPVCLSLRESAAPTRLDLVRSSGDSLCLASGGATTAAMLARLLGQAPAETGRYTDASGTEILAATAPAGQDWSVVATQVAATAFAPKKRLQMQVVFWIGFGVLGALVAGLFLARGITRPIDALSHATSAIAAGNYEFKLTVDGRDEFAKLSQAFNAMSAEVQCWNRELTERVDERTRALTEAQSQLLESKKLTAVAAMSAGIAHEINNPLTAVISFAQVLKARADKKPEEAQQANVLAALADSALRIHDIVQRMQRLSEVEAQGMRETSPMNLVRAAVAATKEQASAAEATFNVDEDEDVGHVFVNASQLEYAISEVISNAIAAFDGPERSIEVRVRRMGEHLTQLDISDTGRGIPEEYLARIFEPFYTQKTEWTGKGLGLAEARQLIINNHGTLRVQSTVGKGTTMSILLPTAETRSHLD